MSRRYLQPEDFGLGMYEAYKDGIYVRKDTNIDMPIFRYIPLEYLLEMLSSNQMYIPNIQSFSDKREIGQLATLNEVINTLSECPSRNDIKRVREQKECINLIPAQFASCWTTDGPTENYCMWKSHQNKPYVCRIQSSIENILSSIQDQKHIILVSPVKYEKIDKPHIRYVSDLFRKVDFYRDEQELRFLFLKMEGDGDHINIGINPQRLISEIILSPFAAPNIRSMIREELVQKYTYLKDKVKFSNLIEY